MWGYGGAALWKMQGVYAGGGMIAFQIVTAVSARREIKRDQAMGMEDLVRVAMAGVALLLLMAVCFRARWIKETPPGVLFLVFC
jgi:hypothetical protein